MRLIKKINKALKHKNAKYIAVIAGILLAVSCQFMPENYKDTCVTLSKITLTTCTGVP